MTLVENPPTVAAPAARSQLGRRAVLVGRAAVLSVTSLFGAALFPLWITLVAVSPLTIVAPLVLPATWLVRRFADANRGAAGRLLGERIGSDYRDTGTGVLRRVWAIVRDPASWRDAGWMVTHAVVGCFLSVLSFSLFASSILYLIYPFLYWVTPPNVFGKPFGFVHLHSTAESFAMMPLGLVTFVLWWFAAPGLARAEAAFTRKWLRP